MPSIPRSLKASKPPSTISTLLLVTYFSVERPSARGGDGAADEELAGTLAHRRRTALDPLEGHALHPRDHHHGQHPCLGRGQDVARFGELANEHLAPLFVHLGDRPADFRLDDRHGGKVEVEASDPL